jgi:hypothetical protein
MLKTGRRGRSWLFAALAVLLALAYVLWISYPIYEDSQRNKRFDSLSGSEHLTRAKRLLSAHQVDEAMRHLQAIPANAPESEEGVKLLVEAKTLKLQEEAAESGVREKQARGGSFLSSYWPTALQVRTDMNSLWLDQEERTCASYPDKSGRVAVIHCDSSEHSDAHNIVVTFWGSVERGKSSDWKCRKQSEKFVCRAIN